MPFSTLFLFGVCLLVSFLYAGIEAGLLSLDRTRLRSRVQQGDRAAVRLDRLLAHPGKLLATVLLVTNFADVAALVLITNVFAPWLGGWGYAAAGGVMLPVYVLGLQLLPKSLFRRFPYRALAALAGLLEMTTRLLSPLLLIGSWLLRRSWVVPHAERDAPVTRRRIVHRPGGIQKTRRRRRTHRRHQPRRTRHDRQRDRFRQPARARADAAAAGGAARARRHVRFGPARFRPRAAAGLPAAHRRGRPARRPSGRVGGRVYPAAGTRPATPRRCVHAPPAAYCRARRTGGAGCCGACARRASTSPPCTIRWGRLWGSCATRTSSGGWSPRGNSDARP